MFKLLLCFFYLCTLLLSSAREHQHHEHTGEHSEKSTVKWESGAESGNVVQQGALRMEGEEMDRDETIRQQWIDHHQNVQDLSTLLFPNKSVVPIERRMAAHQLQKQQKHEKTTGGKRQLVTTIPCVICRDMEYCDALNGYQVSTRYISDLKDVFLWVAKC